MHGTRPPASIEHDQGPVEIVVYDRAILLFTTDSEAVRRIHCPSGFACVNAECCGIGFRAPLCGTSLDPSLSAPGSIWGK